MSGSNLNSDPQVLAFLERMRAKREEINGLYVQEIEAQRALNEAERRAYRSIIDAQTRRRAEEQGLVVLAGELLRYVLECKDEASPEEAEAISNELQELIEQLLANEKNSTARP